jgi:hypothetical protein
MKSTRWFKGRVRDNSTVGRNQTPPDSDYFSMRKTRSSPSSRFLRPVLTMEMEGGNVCPPRHC